MTKAKPAGRKKPKAEPPGQPEHAPLTDRESAEIEALAFCGLPEDQIADYIGTTPARLSAMAGNILRMGEVKGNAKIAQTFFAAAMGREKKVRKVTKTRINANGAAVEYEGQEIEQDARPPIPSLLVYLVEQRLGWTRTVNVRNQSDVPAASAELDKRLAGIDVKRLSDQELANLEGILTKLGFEATSTGSAAAAAFNTRAPAGRTH